MKTIILKLLLLLIISSCNSNDDNNSFTPTLPPITTTGANTFGCYIDGNLLVPRDGEGSFNFPSHGASYFVTGDVPIDFNSSLTIHDFKNNAGLLQLNIEDVQNGEGDFPIKESNCQEWVGGNPNPTINLFCRWQDKDTQEIKYYCSIENTGVLNILKYDRNNGILSATFNCSVVNQNNPEEIIEITEGRFDIIWGTIGDKTFP